MSILRTTSAIALMIAMGGAMAHAQTKPAAHVQPVRDEGSLEATTSRMTADEASAVAKDLVKMLGLIVHS